jgi:hypothetical protein
MFHAKNHDENLHQKTFNAKNLFNRLKVLPFSQKKISNRYNLWSHHGARFCILGHYCNSSRFCIPEFMLRFALAFQNSEIYALEPDKMDILSNFWKPFRFRTGAWFNFRQYSTLVSTLCLNMQKLTYSLLLF